VDSIGGGIVVLLVCLVAAIVLAAGFTVALCRGARKARRDHVG
jgi:hypothetical protein